MCYNLGEVKCLANYVPGVWFLITVGPTMSVQEHQGNEKSCVWIAKDFADGELKDETFCVRFPSIESKILVPFYRCIHILI